jgi:hypothetical protein
VNKENLKKLLILSAAWIVTISTAVMGIAPRLMPVFLAVFSLLALASFLYEDKGREALVTNPTILTFLAFGFYLCVNAFWAVNFEVAVGKALLIIGIVLSCMLATHFFFSMSEQMIWRFVRGIVIGVLIGLFFLSIEFLSNHYLTRTLFNETDLSAGKSGTAAFEGLQKLTKLYNHYFNNQISALNIVFWPSLLMATLWRGATLRRITVLLLICLIIPVTFMSDSESAKLALIMGGIAYFATLYSPALMHKMAITAWSLAVVMVVPIVLIAYEFGLQKNTWLPYSARDRVYIWHYSAVRVIEHPFLGIGIRSSRTLRDDFKRNRDASGHKQLQDRPALHTHNSFLQTWHELGAVGAIFLLSIGLLMLQHIRNLTTAIRPYAYATFASAMPIAAFGYGMWQSWLMSTYGWAVIFLLVAMRYRLSSTKHSS